MSAASRKNDPFNFDDIYRQAGVEDLFVKKTLGELKQKATATGPAPAASPARATPTAQASPPTQNAATFDLDFLSKIATPSTTPAHLSKPNSGANLVASASQQQAPASKPVPNRGTQPVDDPFALFEEVPGAAPVQPHKPSPAPAAVGTNGTGNLLDFDEGNAFSAPAPAPAAQANVGPAAVTAAGTPSLTTLPSLGSASSLSTQPRSAVPETAPSIVGPRPAQPAAGPSPSPSPSASAPRTSLPPLDYASHAQHRPAPLAPGAPSAAASALPPYPQVPDGRPASSAPATTPAGPRDPGPYPEGPYGPDRLQHPQPQQPRRQDPESSAYGPLPDEAATNTSSPSFSWGATPSAASGSGISGVLKAFGKKAVRAAKAGLAQLEHALEGLDQQGSGQHHPQQQHSYGGSAASFESGRSAVGGSGRSLEDVSPPSNDEALAWAVRLADLPPHAQRHELEHMRPALRRKVIEVLREQIRSEHEAASQSQPGAHPPPYVPPSAPGPAAPLGPGLGPSAVSSSGYGHGATMSPHRPEGAGVSGASAPGHGHGAPPPAWRGSEDGSSVGHPGGEASWREGRPGAAAAAAEPPPPSYADAGRHSAAAPPQAHEMHDLLGMGSGEVAPPSQPPPSTAAVTPAPPLRMSNTGTPPVVDDLLGFDDGAAPAATAPPPPRAPAGSPRPAAAAPAAPAAASPPAPPVAVHMDDMDDFFSGGKPSASTSGARTAAATATPAASATGRSASGAMHGSSSAPNLAAGRGGGGAGGSVAAGSAGGSAAGLADMLHDEDDGLGGLGGVADVDVSDYAELYKGEQGLANEPELRKRLRAQREAAKHAKMKAALAEKKAMEAEEAARREQQVALKDQYKTNIEVWKNKHKGNIRGLLGSLHTVLWPDSGWTPVSVGDLLEPAQIKKVYMRANLLVHPDKVRQRNGSADQVAIADMVFDVLKEAWNAFR